MTVSALRSLLVGGVGGAGGVLLSRYILPDITWQEKHKDEINRLPTVQQAEELATALPPAETPPIPPPTTSTLRNILKYGVPSPGIPTIMEYENHVLEYDPVRKVPKWVAEHVSQVKAFGGSANRKLAKFDRDPQVPVQFTAENTDFWGSGWSRGHMAPAGNNKHSQDAMNQTFYLTNIVPQDLDNNGNYWNRLETHCRELTKIYSDVYIISGPLWLPEPVVPGDSSNPSPSYTKPNNPPPKDEKIAVVDEQLRDKKISVINVDNAAGRTLAASLQDTLSPPLTEPLAPSLPETPAPSFPETPAQSLLNSLSPSITEPLAPSLPKTPAPSLPETPAPALPKVEEKKKTGRVRPPKKFVQYEVIGRNNVAVPTHLFKVILVEDPKLETPLLAAFIIPNKPIQDVDLLEYEVELSEVENQVGVRFHQELDKSSVGRLCVIPGGCRMGDYKKFQEFFWTRRISSPWNLWNLEKDWKEACDRGFNSDQLETLYLEKKRQLVEKQNRTKENPPVLVQTPEPGSDTKVAETKPQPIFKPSETPNPAVTAAAG